MKTIIALISLFLLAFSTSYAAKKQPCKKVMEQADYFMKLYVDGMKRDYGDLISVTHGLELKKCVNEKHGIVIIKIYAKYKKKEEIWCNTIKTEAEIILDKFGDLEEVNITEEGEIILDEKCEK